MYSGGRNTSQVAGFLPHFTHPLEPPVAGRAGKSTGSFHRLEIHRRHGNPRLPGPDWGAPVWQSRAHLTTKLRLDPFLGISVPPSLYCIYSVCIHTYTYKHWDHHIRLHSSTPNLKKKKERLLGILHEKSAPALNFSSLDLLGGMQP